MSYGDEYPTIGSKRQPLKGGGATRADADREPIDLITVMTGQKPWYQSTTIIGLLVLVTTIILKRFGIDASDEESTITAIAMGAGEIIGSVMVLIGRLRAKKEIVIKPEVLGLILVALIMIPASGCSSKPQLNKDGEEVKTSSMSIGFEVGTRTVAGPVIDILGYRVGFGVFFPSSTIEKLQKTESSK